VDKDPSSFEKGSATKDTLTELRALTVVQPERKTVTRVKKSAISSSSASKRSTPTNSSTKAVKKQTNATRSTAKSTTTATTPKEKQKEKSVSSPAVAQQKAKEPEEELNENSVCIFCDEVNPEFNEDTLIKHYYNTCPVLTNCPMCQIVSFSKRERERNIKRLTHSIRLLKYLH